MDILPAIDLVGGKCVRLIQGEYHRKITYEDDPVKQAHAFKDADAVWLHIVDLDGARVGKPVNIDAVEAIIAAGVDLKIEIGGGIRDEASIQQMLDVGVQRVIIGTSAVNNFDWFREMAKKFPTKLALSLDSRGSTVSIKGWTQDSQQKLCEFASKCADLPLAVIIYTDITKDGMMAGPNFERTKIMVETVDIPVLAAGGVTDVADILKLRDLGAAGAIIGRALYEGKIDLRDALAAANS